MRVLWMLVAMAATASADCVPPCRGGFMCLADRCVSRCNPACGLGQQCSERGECVSPFAQDLEARARNEIIAGAVLLPLGVALISAGFPLALAVKEPLLDDAISIPLGWSFVSIGAICFIAAISLLPAGFHHRTKARRVQLGRATLTPALALSF